MSELMAKEMVSGKIGLIWVVSSKVGQESMKTDRIVTR